MPWDIIGHQWATELLSQHIAQGQVRHAYLFTGPSGIGRRTLALNLAQAVNCIPSQHSGNPCQSCNSCRRIKVMQHPDLSIIQAEKVGGTLKVEQVRELQRILALTSYEGQYRVAVMQRFEEAHLSAANALLKTLEEPSPKVIIVLTAENTEGLLPTIVSRCEVLRLHPVPDAIITQELSQRWQLPVEQAQLMAQLCGGRPGYAVHLTENNDLLNQRREWIGDLFNMLEANRVERFSFSEILTKPGNRDDVCNLLQVWLMIWRDVLLSVSGAQITLVNQDYLEQIKALSAKLDLFTCQRLVRTITQTLDYIDRNVNMRQSLDVLMLELPYL